MSEHKSKTRNHPMITLFGNPLLDISVILPNEDLLKKYGIGCNSEEEATLETLQSILEDIRTLSLPVKYGAGGSAQNTARLLEWFLGEPGLVAFVGSIGNDENGKKMADIVSGDGVDTRYVVHQNEANGVCLALISGPHRALLANLGAAVKYSLQNLEECENTLLKYNDIIYIETFFIMKRREVCNRITSYCTQHKKIFVLNIGGVYLLPNHGPQIKHYSLQSNILFGNRQEYEALGKVLDLPDIERTAENVALYLNRNRHGKILVVTDNAKPVLCVSGNQLLEYFQVPRLDPGEVVDTTGAGDAFVAGFLAGFIQKKNMKVCAALGCWVARQIICRVGCILPDKAPPKLATWDLINEKNLLES